MLKGLSKKLVAAAMAVSALAMASPASAYYVLEYKNADGSYAGTAAFCDDGRLLYSYGNVTPYFDYFSYAGQPPC